MTRDHPTDDVEGTALVRETREAAGVVARMLADPDRIAPLAAALAARPPRIAAICGRGSSGHAGVHLRYLLEAKLGIPVSTTAPSVVTALDARLDLAGALFVVISQSGRSPDLVAATRAARAAGALTVALVNDDASPVAEAAERVLPIGAGPERSVAATKSVIGAMALGALLVARVTGDTDLLAALARLPERLERACGLDWSPAGEALAGATAAFVTGRGYGFSAAREIALKAMEVLRLPVLAYSAAELPHGPRAAVGARTPVLALRVGDETAAAVDALVGALDAADLPPHLAGGPATRLPWIGDDHPVCDAIAFLAPAYMMIARTARAMGYDPDAPPHLEKVTETL
ncbi:SIS domain-containing protein [Salinarimonas chemoclinalis]|uniref:SIS domain-containing protein n=1 Tax=Salinarimonas chemoclinalis TaxID=3241599 RepID=UPI00355789C1